MTNVVLYTLGKTDKTSRMLRRRLASFQVFHVEMLAKERPTPGTVLLVDATPYTIEEIKTRDTLWKATHPTARASTEDMVPTTCTQPPIDEALPVISAKEDTFNEVTTAMEFLCKSKDSKAAIESMIKKMTEKQKWSFLVGYRLAKHSDARILMREMWRMERLCHEIDPHMIDEVK